VDEDGKVYPGKNIHVDNAFEKLEED